MYSYINLFAIGLRMISLYRFNLWANSYDVTIQMKPTQQYFHMEDTIHLCVVLWTKNCGVSIHIKPLWPSFCTVLFSSLDFLKRNLAYLCLSLGVGGSGVRVKAALGIFCDFPFFLVRHN